MTRVEMTRVETTQRPVVVPARPVIRSVAPLTSLFVEVEPHDMICSIKAQHVRLRALLAVLGERAGLWITAMQHVEGFVSADITEMRLEEALEQIVLPLGYSVGVRGNAILVGLHDEVDGYDHRLSDFAEFERTRVAEHQAELRREAKPLRPADSERQTEGKRAVEPRVDAEQRPQEPVQLASHSEAFRSRSLLANAIPAAQSGPSGVSRAVYAQPAQEIPMHGSPHGARRPSTKAVLDSRRAQLASEEDNIVSIIADRAMNLMRAGEYRRTVNMLSHLVTEHNLSAQLFQLLGEAYYHCDQFQAAEVSLKHSLRLYKNDARANYFMGCTLRSLGERSRSLHYLLQSHDLDPMYPPIVSKQGVAPR